MNSVRQILEIDRILDQVKRYIKTPRGSIILANLDVFDEKNDCKEELARLSEMLSLIEKYNDLPINSHIDIFDEIQKAKKGSVINEKSFNDIKEVLSSCREIIKFYNKIVEKPTLLSAYFTKIVFDEKLYNKINQVITVDNTVADNASPKLNQIRHSLEKSEKEIHTTISKLMITYKDQLSGDNYVLRDGVYVLPINSSYKASVDGLVHDISDSGMTTFIEPLEIVNLENNKHVLEIQEKEEVTRILKELTQNVIQDIKLYLARHPLLDKNTVVPNDFNLGNDKTLMLISGPNAGGKTIALKTVATLCYMTKMGLPIPAGSGSELGFFRKIYVDIGDNQSIENNLSTFSAHISVLSVLLKYISSKDLVVIDELGNGTDPKEGEALSMAVVEFLLDRKCLTLITSHFSLLKQFGLANKNVLSASFIFDDKKIEPTFKIIYDVSGKSYGFAIAKKYGLNDSVVERARKIYEQNYIDDSYRKLEILEDKERSIHEKNEELNLKRKDLDSLSSDLKKKEVALTEKEKNLKDKKIADFDEYLDSKIDEIDDIVDAFKASNKKEAREYIAKLNQISVSKKEKEKIILGDYVEIKGLNVSGKVVRMVGQKVNIVTTDGFSLNASYKKKKKIDKPTTTHYVQTNIDKVILNQKVLSPSINLVGNHIDEGLDKLDKYLSDCYSRGLHVVKVIHGYGSGQLRNAIHEHLKTLSFVESFRLGNDVDGGTGATIVTLK